VSAGTLFVLAIVAACPLMMFLMTRTMHGFEQDTDRTHQPHTHGHHRHGSDRP